MALVVGFIGYLFRRFGVPITPMVIGAILGPLAELYYKRTIQISQGDHSVLFDGLLTTSLYSLLILLIVLPPLYRLVKRGKQSSKKWAIKVNVGCGRF